MDNEAIAEKYAESIIRIDDQVILSHDKMRARLDQHLSDYYGKPE